ncbi:MAG: class I SAM-dependent methyltransferase [Chloroflexota bacterium]
MPKTADIFPANYFRRRDESDDGNFYTFPRKVVHIDDAAIQALSDFYGEAIPLNSTILDLMSSWRSHLPLDSLTPQRVAGLGMNLEEMLDNPALRKDGIQVQNLNLNPTLSYESDVFDAVICAVSVQYLIQPIELFAEVHRVLKENGRFILSYSNRCFPTKATAVWLSTDDMQHAQLIGSYFEHSGSWSEPGLKVKNDENGAPPNEDPLYIIWAEKRPFHE